jgi:hypothetical protein
MLMAVFLLVDQAMGALVALLGCIAPKHEKILTERAPIVGGQATAPTDPKGEKRP